MKPSARLLLNQDELSHSVQREVMSRIRMANGVFRYTYAHRLDDLNDRVSQHLPDTRPLRLIDVGASSGLNTYEWWLSLAQKGVASEITATDQSLGGALVSVGAAFHVLFDDDGNVLQYEVFGLVSNGGVVARALGWPIQLLTPIFRSRGRQAWVDFTDPRARSVPQITFLRHDLMTEPLPVRGDVVRAANLLNRAYFDDQTLRGMIDTLARAVVDGGLLVVCRTNERDENHATIFRRNAERLQIIDRLGAGSEVESLAAQWVSG